MIKMTRSMRDELLLILIFFFFSHYFSVSLSHILHPRLSLYSLSLSLSFCVHVIISISLHISSTLRPFDYKYIIYTSIIVTRLLKVSIVPWYTFALCTWSVGPDFCAKNIIFFWAILDQRFPKVVYIDLLQESAMICEESVTARKKLGVHARCK